MHSGLGDTAASQTDTTINFMFFRGENTERIQQINFMIVRRGNTAKCDEALMLSLGNWQGDSRYHDNTIKLINLPTLYIMCKRAAVPVSIL